MVQVREKRKIPKIKEITKILVTQYICKGNNETFKQDDYKNRASFLI